MIGTPEWLALPRGDRRWWAAVLDAGWHWALLLEGNQEASAQAGQAISTMADWAEVGQRMRDREEFIAKNPWAKRVAT